MTLLWIDIQEISQRLYDKFPETDPLTIRFTDLHKWICELEGFSDDPKRCNERILESIQAAWIDEYN